MMRCSMSWSVRSASVRSSSSAGARRPAIANCGDCLMDHAEVVPMRGSVTSTYTLVTTAPILVLMR